jgi:hypothetical protein
LTSDENDVTPVHGEREILERVHKRGNTLRQRKRFARAASGFVAVAVLLAGGIAIAYQGGGPKPSGGLVNNSAPTEMPTVEPTPSETPTEQPSPSPSPTTTTTCINSYDPVCGKFYWDPAPGPNAPMDATIHASSTTLSVGETVTVTGTATDPDAEIMCQKVEWGPTYIGFAVTLHPKYGRWETPDKKPGHVTETYSHAYDTPGTYRIDFEAESGACGDWRVNPYSSQGSASVTVTVIAASPSPSVSESPSPSPSP